ncbi:plasmid mobilization relaxosome protein MobC [Hymenobacter sp. YC55]|uniref:plasmid mobilization protein n=1 Tax=Hymenobacter sp. YC55 TaxID=3034019 RepID=UPI0023FA256E|nr:plasmid mobilization relaxosome protein MobC [Hymenobacter sp. YC55]MDF7815112.1 plasmid mobilization relaxosome protein MobC [Hymenobacter sp. YC55]
MKTADVPDLASPAEKSTIKDTHINVRISRADKKIIVGKAEKAGLSTNDYVRRAALGKKIVEKVPPDLRRLIAGSVNNLNQLTRLANAGKLNSVSSAQLTDLLNRLLEILK